MEWFGYDVSFVLCVWTMMIESVDMVVHETCEKFLVMYPIKSH
jgi:hypothetical protein